MRSLSTLVFASVPLYVLAGQTPFSTTKVLAQARAGGDPLIPSLHTGSYDAGLFTPIETLAALSESSFTTLNHPAFPHHGVRIKKSTFCDGNVSSYTGYIDIEDRHLFFYFFESRSNPDEDDFIFWTNGGAGASSALGLFMELGPCRVLNEKGPKWHPESWNQKANLFFVDQPIGVGFSYADHGEVVGTTEEAAQDIAAFVAIFFQHFTKYQGRPLHMAGESYGGRYLPLFASAVYDQNPKLIEAGMAPVNLSTVMIGNGMTDYFSMVDGWVEMQCTGASLPAAQNIRSCVRMRQALERCHRWTRKSCIDSFDAMNCNAAVAFCDSEIQAPFWTLGVNPYDMSKACDPETLQETLCYSVTQHIVNYLNVPKVQHQIGVDTPRNFSSVDLRTNQLFTQQLDLYHGETSLYVAALLERGVDILVYVGSYDWICNWVGNEIWTLALEWSGRDEFNSQPLRTWNITDEDGKQHVAGQTRAAKGLTFATIYGAGHMVPYDKPKESLEMVNRWVAGEQL